MILRAVAAGISWLLTAASFLGIFAYINWLTNHTAPSWYDKQDGEKSSREAIIEGLYDGLYVGATCLLVLLFGLLFCISLFLTNEIFREGDDVDSSR